MKFHFQTTGNDFFLLKSVTYRVSATLLNTKNNFQTKDLVTSGALNLSLCWRCLSLYIPWAGCALQHILYPKTQGMEEGKESGRTRKGIRKITSPTLWDYDSTSLILELKPLCTAFDCATCSFKHTQPYTTESITDSVAKGGVAIRVYKLSIALGTNTQSPNHNISKFNASIPPYAIQPATLWT